MRNLRSAATLTNSTNRVNNYNKSGGQNQAWYDFQRMPGNQQQIGNGKYIKAYEGKTVTYYRSTTANHWTLSYPYSTKTDKIFTNSIKFVYQMEVLSEAFKRFYLTIIQK
ncbi:hypothetical protein [Alkalibacillus silvisoli]|uniref:Uncharacterized protein n=1 Tax=Alkalibacillus silvisoli TaxID=392823 RepID=A0ABN0ZQE8_9BACI